MSSFADPKENAHGTVYGKYKDDICGVLTGFDRVVFRGSPRRLDNCYYDAVRRIVVAKGMEELLWQNGVLLKHYGDNVKRQACQ